MTKQLRATMAAILVISSISLQAQTSTATKKTTGKATAHKRAHVESPVERQIRELREQMLSQQAQIDALKQQNADKDAKLAAAQPKLPPPLHRPRLTASPPRSLPTPMPSPASTAP
jgi:Tfp pilus assembly protein FimV